ncbi:hypothetical protein [Domibacillus robiginosus]|uniref:hypothetical protein n=1 Tax=Domibacillus robiginosus TaxID=1071054 RepID=UPI00067C2815|nr:hypothetical protein [Domibacillus robiginosus]
MPILFIVIIAVIAAFLILRYMKKNSVPNNYYTPYDDIELNRSLTSNREKPPHETKHQIPYEEKQRDEKTDSL